MIDSVKRSNQTGRISWIFREHINIVSVSQKYLRNVYGLLYNGSFEESMRAVRMHKLSTK